MQTSRSTSAKKTLKGSPASTYVIIAIAGFVVSILTVYYYLRFIQGKVTEQVDQRIFYLILILFGISASALIFGVMNSYAVLKGEKLDTKFRFTGPIVGVILTVFGGFALPHGSGERTITIRVFDERKNPITQGEVKLYLPGYIRRQSIDNVGQAQFTDLPDKIINAKVKLEVSSQGYGAYSTDTLLENTAPLEVTLAQTRMIRITGRIKNAGEVPIRNVEINVDGTKFFAMSITDGTYSLQLEDYAVGDMVTITTSHKDYEDKTVSLRLSSPTIENIDFVLNPVAH